MQATMTPTHDSITDQTMVSTESAVSSVRIVILEWKCYIQVEFFDVSKVVTYGMRTALTTVRLCNIISNLPRLH